MRIILAFALMLFLMAPALAEEAQTQEPQQQGRDCPGDYTDVGGVCKPPCQPPLKRNAAGQCVADQCSEAQEYFNGRCVRKCPEGQERSAGGGVACVDKCPGENQVRNTQGECVQSLCPPGQAIIGGRCAPTAKASNKGIFLRPLLKNNKASL